MEANQLLQAEKEELLQGGHSYLTIFGPADLQSVFSSLLTFFKGNHFT
jgi:hypothetical protein